MAATTYSIFDIQLTDPFLGTSLIAPGGLLYVAVAGGARKATLVNPDNNYAALANPFAPTAGKARFAIANVAGATLGSTTVDLYGMTAGGRFFIYRGASVGNPTEIGVGGNARRETAIIPFSIADTTAATETDTGFVLPTGALVLPDVAIVVKTLESGKTINVGLLSSQSGGVAAGFILASSLTAAGAVKTTMAGTPTFGSLLKATVASNPVPEAALIGATAVNVSYTLSSASAAAEGFIVLPYQLTA